MELQSRPESSGINHCIERLQISSIQQFIPEPGAQARLVVLTVKL